MKYKVLLTSVGGYLGLQNIDFLKKAFRNDVWILAADNRYVDLAKISANKFIKLPKGDDRSYIDAVIKSVQTYKINYIIPCSDEEAISLSSHLEKFNLLKVVVFCQSKETNDIITNKITTYEFLKKNNIPIAEFKVAKTKKEFNKYFKYFHEKYKSIVVKEAKTRGNRGTFLISEDIKGCNKFNDSRELHISFNYFKKNKYKILNSKYPKILSERLFSPCYDLDLLSKNGKLICNISRERINPAGVPFRGNIIRRRKKLDLLASKLSILLKLHGLVDVDVMTKSNGEPAIIEINPRASGSSVVSMVLGVPLYKILLQLNSKKKFNVKAPKDGTMVVPSVECKIVKNEK